MNLDLLHPLGHPAPERLAGLPGVRLLYNVSHGAGSLDLNAAFHMYNPYLQALKQQNLNIVVVLNHQTYGEGRGFEWNQMNEARWYQFINEFSQFVESIARQYAGRGLVYEVWNEQDAPAGAVASVPVPATIYGTMYRSIKAAIQQHDTSAKIITGGFVTGAGEATAYFRKAGITAVCQGIAVHPYGQGARNNPHFKPFGNIEDYLTIWRNETALPLWITEFGVLGQPGAPLNQVIDYARDYIHAVKSRAVCCLWYAWADTMHDGYGVVNSSGQIKLDAQGRSLLNALRGNVVPPPPQPPVPPTDEPGLQAYVTGANVVNARALPTTSAAKIGEVRTGLAINSILEVRYIAPYTWLKVNGVMGGQARDYWFAAVSSSWRVDVR